MSGEPRHRRIARLFVNREFQVRMLRRALAPLLLLGVAFGLLLHVLVPPEAAIAGRTVRLVGFVGLIGLFVFAAGGIFWSLTLFSRRVAGPLLQLRRTLEELDEGDLTVRMRVRKRDELQEHTEHLNRTIASLQERVVRIQQFCRYTQRSIDEMRAENPGNPQLERMQELVRSIEESVENFKVR